MMKNLIFVLALTSSALYAFAAEPNWNADPVLGAREAMKEQQPVAAAAAKPAGPVVSGLVGKPVSGFDLHPYAQEIKAGHQMNKAEDWSFLAKADDKLVVDFSVCDNTIDDCKGLLFSFPQLSVDLKKGTISYGSEVVGYAKPAGGNVVGDTLFDRAYSIEWASGYQMRHQLSVGSDGLTRVSMILSKSAAQAYVGSARTAKGSSSICLEVSPEEVDRYAGDPDISQGVFVYRAVEIRGAGGCSTTWELNGDYLRDCGGAFLVGLKGVLASSSGSGEVFDSLERFDPSTGALTRKPIGRYELRKTASCP